MWILSRYVISHILLASFSVLGIILAIDVIFAFFDELGHLEGDYTAIDALWYSILLGPMRIVEFSVVSLLIGGLVGLGLLASNAELIVMRSAGIDLLKLLGMGFVAALIFSLMSLASAQWLVPYTAQKAESFKSQKVGFFGKYNRGVWLRDDQDFIYVGRMTPEGDIDRMTIFHYENEKKLAMTSVETGQYQEAQKAWRLENVQTTGVDLQNKTLVVDQQKEKNWNAQVTPEHLILLQLKPEHLSLTGLWSYAQYLSQQSLYKDRYALMFWHILLQPLASMIMIVLSLSMVMGSMRSVSMGYRITLGLIFGFSFYYLQEVFGFFSLVYGIHPLLSFMMPLSVFLVVGCYRLKQVA